MKPTHTPTTRLTHSFRKGELRIKTDANWQLCIKTADALCDNGYEVTEIRRTDGRVWNIITVECLKKDILNIVEFCKTALKL